MNREQLDAFYSLPEQLRQNVKQIIITHEVFTIREGCSLKTETRPKITIEYYDPRRNDKHLERQ